MVSVKFIAATTTRYKSLQWLVSAVQLCRGCMRAAVCMRFDLVLSPSCKKMLYLLTPATLGTGMPHIPQPSQRPPRVRMSKQLRTNAVPCRPRRIADVVRRGPAGPEAERRKVAQCTPCSPQVVHTAKSVSLVSLQVPPPTTSSKSLLCHVHFIGSFALWTVKAWHL